MRVLQGRAGPKKSGLYRKYNPLCVYGQVILEGFEPPTFPFGGERSNPTELQDQQRSRRDSNPRPSASKAAALVQLSYENKSYPTQTRPFAIQTLSGWSSPRSLRSASSLRLSFFSMRSTNFSWLRMS